MSHHPHCKKITTLSEMLLNLALIQELTPSLTLETYEQFLKEMIPHNYAQVLAYVNDEVVGLSGYWIGTKLYCGRYLEIDNFVVTASNRNAGIGKLLLDWLEQEASQHNCKVMMLDAYVENFKAHTFYHRHGFHARGFHYMKHLEIK